MMKNFGLYIGLLGILCTVQFITAKQAKEITIESPIEVIYDQDEFVAIGTDEVAEAVRRAVEKEYPTAGIAEAFKDLLGNYKLILVLDQDTKVVYLDANGNWYSPERQG